MKNVEQRTKQFAIDCWKLCTKIPKSREYNAFVNQLIRSSSAVGANFRASQRGKFDKDFINKLKIFEEECYESLYWLEIFMEITEENQNEFKKLHDEANELLAIIVSSINTTRKRLDKKWN